MPEPEELLPPAPTAIGSFRDAVGFAMELADHHAFATAALLLGPGHRPIDLAVVGGLGGSIETVVAWAAGACRLTGPRRTVLVVSVRAVDPDVVAEADIRRYRHADWSLTRAGGQLIDWIETDGDVYRSYAYLIHPARAWAHDPPADRFADGGPT